MIIWLGRHLRAWAAAIGAISCVGVLVLVALQNPATNDAAMGSRISGAFDRGSVDLAENDYHYSNNQQLATNDNNQSKLVTREDAPLEIRLDDIMAKHDTLSYGIALYPSHGRLDLDSSSNKVTYFPDADFYGDDSFALEFILGIVDAEQIPYNISVTPVNDYPVAEDDLILTDEYTAIDIKALDNDYDIDGDQITVISISNPLHGSATISNDRATIVYEPKKDYSGADSFSYAIIDSIGEKSTADISITIASVNEAPVAKDDFVTTKEDNAVVIKALSNDNDKDNDNLVILSITDPSNGSARISDSGGTITYYPSANFDGADEFKYTISDGALVNSANVKVVVEPVTDHPVAVAGLDRTVTENSLVTLDGSDSLDPDGLIVSYHWEQIGDLRLSVDFMGDNGKIVEFVAPNVTAVVDLTFRLTVVDSAGNSRSDQVSVNVTNVNHAPTANAGADQTAIEDELITLNGSATFDADGDAITYSWEQERGPVVSLSENNSPNPSFRVPSFGSGDPTLTFMLRVNDGNGGIDDDVVKVYVTDINQPPVAHAHGDMTVNEGELAELDGSDSYDPDGHSLTYSWKQLEGPDVSLSNRNSAKPTFTAPYDLDSDENLVFELKVSDWEFTSTDTIVITVADTITTPKILGTPDYLEDLIYEISQAKEFVYASTYYLEDYPDNQLLDALENATKRGVDVRVTFAEPTLILYPNIEESLTARGIPYEIVFNHAKVVVIDDKMVYVGSANWNKNGLERNWELSIKTNNPDTVKEAKAFVDTMWRTGEKIVRYNDYPEERFVNGPEFYEQLIQNIRNAEKIKVLMFQATYNFDDPSAYDSEVLDEIKNAYGRGADLQLLFDDPRYYQVYGGRQFLTQNDIPHKLDDKTTGDLQTIHAKAVLINDEILIIGSQNWSSDSLASASEASIITSNPETISAFLHIFDQKWNAAQYVVGG